MDTPEGFTRAAEERFRAHAPELALQAVSVLTLRTAPSSGRNVQVNLDRIWGICETDRSACEATLDDFVSSVSETLRGSEQDERASLEQLLPVLRPSDYAMDQALAGTPFAGDLASFVVVDFPTSVRFLVENDLTALAVTYEAARARALQNLAARFESFDEHLAIAGAQQIGQVAIEDFYVSSLPLLHAQWGRFATRCGGALHIAVPDGSAVLYVCSSDFDAITALRVATAGVYERAQRPISAVIFRWTAEAWVPVPP
jgi:uncharacterized protein YtpQ (UPF0354 family)